ncbi:RagB/SusD family nutrient uptake outer membrane protein [Chryseosolibacter indicus]|uniref:RagB/SusD family nutrient uptake outer membrane protein n=1 Tax=Chryseosolibacter indicus TaxID=2782351 RepID=A0ABS5VNX0_9BACT|nr:RagB/SusD family nutrient uptake outer membrane protein [Chryseosolibacter indicus]
MEPRNQIAPDAALADAASYEALVISIYDRLQTFTYWGRDMSLLGETLADNAFVVTSQASGRYTGTIRNTRNSHFNIWTTAYAAINECNTVIATIDDIDDPDQAKKDQLKGEALFLRALVYFDLARIYGYEPTKVPTTGPGAGWDKSVILRTEPVREAADAALQTRATQTEVYGQIEQDLINAGRLLPKDNEMTVFRANKGAAYALLGKIYLYWEKWDKAVVNFDSALNNTSASLMQAGDYATGFKSIPNDESFFEINFIQSVEVAGVEGVNNSAFSYTQPTGTNPLKLSTYGGMTPSAELLALYEPNDDRKGIFYVSASSTSNGVTYTWSNKYAGAGGVYTDNIKVIRLADVLLMKAEALAMLGDYSGAADLVTELRTQRNATAPVPQDASIIDFIAQERRRELFFEGSHRWFDLKRRGQPITKAAATAVGTIAYDDYRLLAPIPNAEVILNPEGLPQNPNY